MKSQLWTRIVFYITLFSAVVFMLIGLLTPPPGVIDKSVLEGSGILLFFATIAQIPDFIHAGHQIKIDKGDTHIEVRKQDDETEN
jgi:hypothetical protein